jgi:long-chain acyl-CoA synthetase
MIGPIVTMKRWWRHEDPVPAAETVRLKVLEAPQAPVEEPWIRQLEKAGIPTTLTYPSTTLTRLLDQTADRFAESPALFFENESWTYRELLAAVNRTAGGLATLGVRSGDRVLLALPNCPEFFMAFFAVQKLGAVVINAGPLMGVDDLATIITMTTPRLVIGLDLLSAGLTSADEGSMIKHWVWVSLQSYQPVLKWLGYQYKLWHGGKRNGHGGHHTTFADLLENAPARPPTLEPDRDQTAVLQPTGGTTGSLKLAELTHRNLLCNAAQIGAWMGVQQGQDRILAVLPLFHVYGLTLNLIAAVYGASSVVLTTRFHCGEVLELIRRHHPTIFPLVPAICDAISNQLDSENPTASDNTLQDLRLCISGSAPLPLAVAERFEKLTGAQVIEGYGLTEAAPVTHANIPGHLRAGSIGLPMADTRVRVVDLDDSSRQVGPQEPGEMLISGPQVMRGYYANPDQTRRVLTTDDDGTVWLHTGDVVRYDEDGYFYVLDRKKDMIIRSGLKIYPGKVERVLRMHPAVADAAVFGRPDLVHTEIVVATIVLAEASREDSADERRDFVNELRHLCREHLAPYEVPAAFDFADKLPRSPLGKLLRRKLRAPAPQDEKEAV